MTKEGFEGAEIKNIALEVGARPSFEVTLAAGRVSTVMSVTAESIVQLETESNVIGTVVDSSRVQELPLNGRNYLQLALLSGGAVQANVRSDAISGQTGATITRSCWRECRQLHRIHDRWHCCSGRTIGRIGAESVSCRDRSIQSADELLHARSGTESGTRKPDDEERRQSIPRRAV